MVPVRSHRRAASRLLVALSAAALGGGALPGPAQAVPVAAATGPPAATSVAEEPSSTEERLRHEREELDTSAAELDELRAAVRRVDDEVVALDGDLREASTSLADVSEELTEARAEHEAALQEASDARATLAAVDEDLDAALAGWRTNREQLASRARHTYKHGGGASQDVLVRGVVAADDWHEVAVTLETVVRLIEADAELVAGDAEASRRTADLRERATDARERADDGVRTTARQARRVEELVTERRDLVAEVTTATERRRTILTELEDDADARAVLVADLGSTVAELERAAEAEAEAREEEAERRARELRARGRAEARDDTSFDRGGSEEDAATAGGRSPVGGGSTGSTRPTMPSVQVDLDRFGAPPAWAHGLGSEGRTWSAAIEATARRHGIDPRLLASLIWVESGFDPTTVSPAGALGLSQLMPATARGLGVDPYDPLQNLEGGARYLRSQLDRFGRIDLALAAYNAGPGRVAAAKGVPDLVETQLYVTRVLDRYQRLGG